MKVEFYKHSIDEGDIREVNDTLRGLFLTTGQKTRQFEAEFAEYLGAERVVGTNSWSSAAFLVLKAWGIGPGDEVIVSPLSFVANANVVLHCEATPVFVDVDGFTGNIGINEIESAITPRTKVIFPVHLYGQMADMKSIRKLADQHGIKVLEDCAHTIEGRREDYGPGLLGDAACFSFSATKNITCGEGGAVATQDGALARKILSLRHHGINRSASDRHNTRPVPLDMECVGYKANMSDIQAALLVNQLKRIELLYSRRVALCEYYESRFRESSIQTLKIAKNSKSARHLFTILAPVGTRDELVNRLFDAGIGTSVHFKAIHLMKYYRDTFGFREGAFPKAEEISARTLSLPLYPRLTNQEAEYVANQVLKGIERS